MAQLFPRFIRAAIATSALATAMSLPLAAATPAPRAQEAQKKQKDSDDSKKKWTKSERRDLIKRAQVWSPTDIPSMDLWQGPQGPGAFQPWEEVACDYVLREEISGASPKFYCDLGNGDVVKVRYGVDNGEVEGQVAATRLLWALGFGADRVYPVKVTCRGCSADPWVDREPTTGEHFFELAAIERKFSGEEIKADEDGGWSWKELRHVDERLGGASPAQLDAMRLLAVMIQHSDNKIVNERFVCLPGGTTDEGGCERPFLLMHDVGLTFGHANMFNDANGASVSFDEWVSTPMWRSSPKMCVGHMRRAANGMLGDPQISEAGRKFLADLLVQLSDKQIHDMFRVARVDQRSRKPGTEEPSASLDEWVNAFKTKRDEIVNNQCEK